MTIALPLKLPLKGATRIGIRDTVALSKGGSLAQAYLARMTGAEFGFADLTRLFTTNFGPTTVATAGDAIGLIVSREKQDGKTLPQTMAPQTELRGNGTLTLLGSATAATYNPSTGVGSATRVDASNQSAVQFSVVANALYEIDLEATSANGVLIRSGPSIPASAADIAVPANTRQKLYVRPSNVVLYIAALSNALTCPFVVHSLRRVPAQYATQATGGSRGSYQAGGILRVATDDVYPSSVLPGKLLMVRAKLTGGSGTRVVAGSSGNATGRWNLYFNTSGQAACRVGDGAEQAAGADRTNVDGTIAIRRRDDNTIDLVIDGVVVNSAAMSGTPTTTQTISIGATNNNGTAASFFWGDIITGSKGDAIISGDIAPTDAELLALHNYLMAA